MFSYVEACDYLAGLQKFGIKLGLAQVSELLDGIGNPQHKLRFIHLAGSNGKGSTAAMLNSALKAAGFTVGLYSSPHLISPLERLRVNGVAITESEFAELVSTVRAEAERMEQAGRCPTYFEFTTVMAAEYFYRRKVDFVIWETGMGGRFDATNVVNPVCSVITGIAFDHQQYLGEKLSEIAFEKAGIIKPERPVFCGMMEDSAFQVIADKSVAVGSQLIKTYSGFEPENVRISFDDGICRQKFAYMGYAINLALPGKMQRQNFMTVFAVLNYLSAEFNFNLKDALTGLENVKWPARCQFLPGKTIIDGGHNPDGINALTESLSELLPGEKFTIIFGGFADKNTVECLKLLAPLAEKFVFLPVDCTFRRSWTGEELCEQLRSFSNIPCQSAENGVAALKLAAKYRWRLIAGSLYLAGDFLKILGLKEDVLNI
ncbi:MAG: folylpolyglutamate synthase/dihydrofolate synthase family protein [Victivallaceae bacterium]